MKKIYSASLLFIFCFTQLTSILNAQSCWSALGTGAGQNSYTEGITAMTTYNGNLIAGGFFDTVGGIAANNIAAWNGSSWSALGSGVNRKLYAGFYNGISALAVYNNELYAAGSFDTAGGMRVNGIAKWDGTTWTPVGGGVTGYISGVDTLAPEIASMVVYNGSLYVAGSFYKAGGVTTNNVARWDGTTWSAVGAGIGSLNQGGVDCLAVYNGLLYAGGGFLNASGLSAQNIASWNGTTWAALGSGVGPDTLNQGGVLAMAPYDGGIVAAVASQSQFEQVFSLAKWDGAAWSSFAGGPGTGIYYPGIVLTLFPFNGNLIAEGEFNQLGSDTAAQGIEIWNGSTWSNFGGANDTALYYTATTYKNHLYTGGFFVEIGSTFTRNIAEYNCQTTTVIAQVKSDAAIQVYPNPTGGIINFSIQNVQAESTLQVYNLLGEMVCNKRMVNGKNEIDLTGAAKGVYFYRIAGSNGESISSGTFIVQ